LKIRIFSEVQMNHLSLSPLIITFLVFRSEACPFIPVMIGALKIVQCGSTSLSGTNSVLLAIARKKISPQCKTLNLSFSASLNYVFVLGFLLEESLIHSLEGNDFFP